MVADAVSLMLRVLVARSRCRKSVGRAVRASIQPWLTMLESSGTGRAGVWRASRAGSGSRFWNFVLW